MTISPSLRKGTNIEERVPNMIESLFSLAESHASAFNFSDVEEWIKDAVKGLAGSKKREIINDLIIAAYNNAKENLKKKSAEELSKVTGGLNLPLDFKLPF